MKFLLLNQAFHPDVVSTAQHLSDLAVALAARGHEVTVIASRRAYDKPSRRFPKYEQWRGVRVHRIATTAFGKSAKWRRAVDFGSFIFFCICRLLVVPKPDVVVALTSPPLISFIGAVYARIRGVRFVYWVMDLNPDEAIAAKWLRDDSFLARLLNAMSRFSLRHAHRIVALDRFMFARIEAKGVEHGRIVILPPWSHDDAVEFDSIGREKFRKANGLSDKFVVMYSGNHSPCHPLDTLLDAATALGKDSRFVFLFIGGGSEFGRIQGLAAERNLSNVRCLPYQPLEHLSASLSAADLHVVVMGEAFPGTIHPCKIYNILKVGAPVLSIGPIPSHLSEVLDGLASDVCATVAHGDVEGCLAKIQQIAQMGRRGETEKYRVASELFSQRVLLPRLVQELVHTD